MKSIFKILNFDFKLKIFLVLCYTFLVIILNFLSYGSAINFDFWRDDWFTIWAGKFQPSLIWGNDRNRFLAPLFNWFLINIIGADQSRWQILGLIFKIFASFLIGVAGYLFFRSLVVGLFASLIFSAGPYSLESFVWARFTGFILILCLLVFIFYNLSLLKINFWKRTFLFFISNLFSSLVFLFDLWRGIALLFMLPFFEFILFISKNKLPSYSFKESLSRFFVFLSLQLYVIKVILGTTAGSSQNFDLVLNIRSIMTRIINEGYYTRFFITIGNIVRSPIFATQEEGGLSAGDNLSLILGIIFVLILLSVSFLFLITKHQVLGQLIFLLWWFVLFYMPNWLYEPMTSLGVAHRYVSIGNVGFVLLIAFLVSKLSKHYRWGFVSLLIAFYLFHSYKIISTDEKFRSSNIVRSMWDTVIKTVPIYTKDVVLNVSGDHGLRGYIFDWSGVYPYVYFRGIRSYAEFPVFANKNTMVGLMCDADTEVTDWQKGGTKKSGKTYKPEDIYTWAIDYYGIIKDTTEESRLYVVKNAPCLWKDIGRDFAYAYLSSVDSENKYSALMIKKNSVNPSKNQELSFVFLNGKGEKVRTLNYYPKNQEISVIKFQNNKELGDLKVFASCIGKAACR